MTSHDKLRDWVAKEYFTFPVLRCLYCRMNSPLPKGNGYKVHTEYHFNGLRADVAVTDPSGEIQCTIEVVATHPPSAAVLTSQGVFPAAFYIALDAAQPGGLQSWCSVFCWSNRGEVRECVLHKCWKCGRVGTSPNGGLRQSALGTFQCRHCFGVAHPYFRGGLHPTPSRRLHECYPA